MIYFTKAGDTANSIAHRVNGSVDASLAKQIHLSNLNSSAFSLMGGGKCYAGNRAVWVPEGEDIDSVTRDDVLRGFDFIFSHQRANLAHAQEMGIDIHALINAHKLTDYANQQTKDPSIGLAGGAFAYKMADRIVELKEKRVHGFKEALEGIKIRMKDMANATTHDAKVLAKRAYRSAYEELQIAHQYELNEFNLRSGLLHRVSGAQKFIRQKKGWAIYDKLVMRDVEQVARCLTYLGRGMFGLELADSADDVIDAYRDGKDWVKDLIKETSEVVVSAILPDVIDAGLLVFLGFTPIGWVAIVATAAFEVGTVLATNYAIEKEFQN